MNKNLILLVAQVINQHYYKLCNSAFSNVLYLDFLCVFAMNEKNIYCELTLLYETISCIIQVLDQELSLLEFSKKKYDHLY